MIGALFWGGLLLGATSGFNLVVGGDTSDWRRNLVADASSIVGVVIGAAMIVAAIWLGSAVCQ